MPDAQKRIVRVDSSNWRIELPGGVLALDFSRLAPTKVGTARAKLALLLIRLVYQNLIENGARVFVYNENAQGQFRQYLTDAGIESCPSLTAANVRLLWNQLGFRRADAGQEEIEFNLRTPYRLHLMYGSEPWDMSEALAAENYTIRTVTQLFDATLRYYKRREPKPPRELLPKIREDMAILADLLGTRATAANGVAEIPAANIEWSFECAPDAPLPELAVPASLNQVDPSAGHMVVPATRHAFDLRSALDEALKYAAEPAWFRPHGPTWVDFEHGRVAGHDSVLAAVAARLQEFEVAAIVGPASAGKSTLLRQLGYKLQKERPDRTILYIDPRAWVDMPDLEEVIPKNSDALVLLDDPHLKAVQDLAVQLIGLAEQGAFQLVLAMREWEPHSLEPNGLPPQLRRLMDKGIRAAFDSDAMLKLFVQTSTQTAIWRISDVASMLDKAVPGWRSDGLLTAFGLQLLHERGGLSPEDVRRLVIQRVTTEYLGESMIPDAERVIFPLALAGQFDQMVRRRALEKFFGATTDIFKGLLQAREIVPHPDAPSTYALAHRSLARLYSNHFAEVALDRLQVADPEVFKGTHPSTSAEAQVGRLLAKIFLHGRTHLDTLRLCQLIADAVTEHRDELALAAIGELAREIESCPDFLEVAGMATILASIWMRAQLDFLAAGTTPSGVDPYTAYAALDQRILPAIAPLAEALAGLMLPLSEGDSEGRAKCFLLLLFAHAHPALMEPFRRFLVARTFLMRAEHLSELLRLASLGGPQFLYDVLLMAVPWNLIAKANEIQEPGLKTYTHCMVTRLCLAAVRCEAKEQSVPLLLDDLHRAHAELLSTLPKGSHLRGMATGLDWVFDAHPPVFNRFERHRAERFRRTSRRSQATMTALHEAVCAACATVRYAFHRPDALQTGLPSTARQSWEELVKAPDEFMYLYDLLAQLELDFPADPSGGFELPADCACRDYLLTAERLCASRCRQAPRERHGVLATTSARWQCPCDKGLIRKWETELKAASVRDANPPDAPKHL